MSQILEKHTRTMYLSYCALGTCRGEAGRPNFQATSALLLRLSQEPLFLCPPTYDGR